MNTAQQQHPTTVQLLAFAQGRLPPQEFEAIEEHIGDCDVCCQWMARQPDNTLLALAREVATVGFRKEQPARVSPSGEIPAALQNHPRYRVIEQIGIGGMGAVYSAEHRLMQRTVALKIVHPWLLANAPAVERFQREVRVAAKLAHPNIVTSYDADQVENLHFLVMEYVAGESLGERIGKQGPATIEQACDWIGQAARGLQHAHEQGMAHRDIKPHNLMLTTEGQIKILDFGLSRVVAERLLDASDNTAGSSDPSETHADMILGTPDYIAPEQIANSRSADIRSDLYSLGCTLYFLLTGRPPFVANTVVARLHAHESTPFPRIDIARPEVPPKLVEILQRATAKRPQDRYATPAEFERDLASLTTNPPSSTSTVVPPPLPDHSPTKSTVNQQSLRGKPASPLSRRNLVMAGTAFVVLALAAVAYQSGAFATQSTRLLVMLPSKGLWYPDYQSLIDAAAANNAKLTFAGASIEPAELLSTSTPGFAAADVKLGPAVRADDYDAIIFIGHDVNEFSPQGAMGAETKRLLVEFQRQKKAVASLCSGQRVLAQHGILRGKRVAPCKAIKNAEIVAEGGVVGGRPVLTDGLVITAGHSQDAPELLQAIAKLQIE